jgi:hypothetical protein
MEVDALLLADFDAFGAYNGVVSQALIDINDISGGDRLGKRRVDGPPGRQTGVELIRPHNRTHLGAIAAGGAVLLGNIPGFFQNPDLEVSDMSFYVDHFGEGEELYSGMPTGIRHLRPEYSD